EAGASNHKTAASEVPPFGDVPAAAALEPSQVGVATADPPATIESLKRGRDGIDANAPPKSLQRDHADPRPSGSSHRGKSLAAIQLGLSSTASMHEDAPTGYNVNLASQVAKGSQLRLRFEQKAKLLKKSVAQVAHRDKRIQAQELEIKNLEALLETEADMKKAAEDKSARLIKELEDMCARFSDLQEAKLLKKSVAQVARRDKRIQARELEIKNLEALLETEAETKRAAEGKNAELMRELEDVRAQFLDLKVSNEHLSQQVASLQEQVSGEEKLKAAFEEFKRYEDDRVEQWCAKLDARLYALSIDFDEELYPHMLTGIAGRRWVIGHGLRLAMMKCAESLEMRQAFADVVSAGVAKGMSEGLKHGVEHGRTQLELESIEAYD
nr:hypothetical protein [Tanacetum cinerariifolium]